MALSTTLLDADAATIIADLTQTMTFNGASYACAANDAGAGMAVDAAGLFADADLAITVRTTLFTTRPAANDKIAYNGVTYRVQRVTTAPDDVTMTLYCAAESRKA